MVEQVEPRREGDVANPIVRDPEGGDRAVGPEVVALSDTKKSPLVRAAGARTRNRHR